MIVKHPTLDIQHDVADLDVPKWESQGWIPLLGDDQREQLDEIEAEVARPCPTCNAPAASPCVTPSGVPAKHTHAARLKG